jgi:hypothetical protein
MHVTCRTHLILLYLSTGIEIVKFPITEGYTKPKKTAPYNFLNNEKFHQEVRCARKLLLFGCMKGRDRESRSAQTRGSEPLFLYSLITFHFHYKSVPESKYTNEFLDFNETSLRTALYSRASLRDQIVWSFPSHICICVVSLPRTTSHNKQEYTLLIHFVHNSH